MAALLRALIVALVCTTVTAEEQVWTPNFRDADIREVIRFVSNAVGAKSTVIDPLVKGTKVDVISQEPLTKQELYHLFSTILDIHGYTAVNSGGVLRVIPVKEARSAPIPVSSDEITSGYVTEIVNLKYVSAPKVVPALRPLVPQHSNIAAYGNSALVITDTVANIERIRALIKKLDITSKIENELVPLRYAHAEEMVQTINQLQKSGSANDGQQQKQVTLVAESRTNSILVRGDNLAREEVKNLIRQLDRPGPQTGNVRTVYLQHADAVSLEKVLGGVIQNMEQPGGQAGGQQKRSAVVSDPDTNSLIITAQGDALDSLLQVIERLDIRRSNILIEAVIAEVSDTLNRDLGVEWFFTDEDNGTFGSSVNATTRTRLGPLAAAVGNTDSDVDTQTAIAGALSQIPGQTFGIGRLNSTVDFSVVINALHDDTDSNILATPYLTTMDNSEAEFESGQEVPFVTGTSTNTSGDAGNVFNQIERRPIGDILKVTPHVNQGGNMELEISLEVSSLSNATASDIITNQRKISTNIRVNDGEMIVLGGLIRDDLQDVERKVPLLGSIPLLGRLFRSTSTELKKNNLMVFIRAKILHDDQDTYDYTAEKYDFIRERQKDMRDNSRGWIDKEKIPVLPKWSEPKPQPKTEPREQQPE